MRKVPTVSEARSAFSLLEVLVASAILGVVMMVLLSTLSTSLSLWRNTESKAIADREARAAELLIAQDLANVVMATNPSLWPRVVGSGPGAALQFLTLKPREYQEAGDSGDVCFVEYRVSLETASLQRSFLGSAATYSNILKKGQFPQPGGSAAPQLLAGNLLANNRDAVRGLAIQSEAATNNFIILNTNLLPLTGSYSTNNRPAAVEVNFAVTDPDTLRNTSLLGNPNYILRNAGLYSFRSFLPPPPEFSDPDAVVITGP
jgi:prepilin-type N-terminal cleavage/methylation domain-containing protein